MGELRQAQQSFDSHVMRVIGRLGKVMVQAEEAFVLKRAH